MRGYLFKRGSTFYLRRVVDGERVTSSLGVTTRQEAEVERKRLLAEDRATVRLTDRLPAGSAWDIFCRSPRRRPCSPATLAGYCQQWGRFAKGLTEGATLADLTRETASAYLNTLKGKVGANTFNKHVGCLRYVWKVLQSESGVALPDVWQGVQSVPVPLVRHEAFTTEQVRALYAAAPDGSELRDIILVAAHTGLRRVDCLTLAKASVSLKDRLLVLVPVKTRRTGAQAVLGLSDPCFTVLLRRISGVCRDGEDLFPEAAALMRSCPQTWGARFQRFMVSTLNLNGDARLYGFHSFRHFFSSRLTEAGVSDRLINAMMCHGQGKVQARYVHPSADALMAAVGKLPAIG